MDLLNNIFEKISFLSNDFIGLSFHGEGVIAFFISFLTALLIFIFFYIFGERLRKLFFPEQEKYTFFLSIALGYISSGTLLGILGFFSLLTPVVLFILFCFILLFIGYRWPFIGKHIYIKNFIPKKIEFNHVVIIAVFFFVLISFLRLMNPEIGEDGYHTDNAKLFVISHTTMLPSREMLHTIPFPQLPEMVYVIPLLFNDREAARFIHFGFYLLIILFLFAVAKEKENNATILLPLLFATTPVVIRNASSQYTDFFAIFCFLLSVFIIGKNISKKTALLSGLFFGAVVSAKMWMLVYLPAVLFYLLILNRKYLFNTLFIRGSLFILGYLLIAGIWYSRAYLLIGNPIFPIMNTLFIKELPTAVSIIPYVNSSHYVGVNMGMFSYETLVGLSPFFFLGLLSLFLLGLKRLRSIFRHPLFILFLLLTVEQVFVHIDWGRYLLLWFLVTGFFVSQGLYFIIKKNIFAQVIGISLFLMVFGYYFINTVLVLPYGFGWANNNAYLTRVLGRDNVSYYDFNGDFRKWISEKDIVGTYDLGSFYYADFSYIDVGYVLSGKKESVMKLKENGVTMLLIKGGNYLWFCDRVHLSDCKEDDVKRLATYPDFEKYNLYKFQE